MFCCLSSSSSLRMKMIFIILLLLILSSCLCAATFVVNVTQSSYQAEENHSITLEWTFTSKTQGSYRKLSIICEFRTSVKSGIIYVHHNRVDFPKSQDEQFSGRVQSDKDVLREGRIRLHVSRLRTEDSGQYVCDVETEDGSSNAECRLNVFGQVKVVGHEPIHAKVGDDVILPCHLEPPFDVNNLTIKWKFQDQKILVHHRGAENDKTPDPKYQNRTFMFHDEFKKGNISLKLIKVTKEDEGIYTCFVPNLQSKVRKGNVTLKLDKNGAQNNLNVPGVTGPHPGVIIGAGFVLVVSFILLIFIIYYGVRHHRVFYARARTFLKGEMMEIGEKMVTKEMEMKKDLLQEQQNQSV